MAKVKKSMKKYADGGPMQSKPTADSTGIYSRKLLKAYGERDFEGAKKASDNVVRQGKKGKPGYDANGFPVKKAKAKAGASLKPVAADKKKSLGQLPEAVRHQMGYQKDGGKVKAKSGASMKKCKYGCK
jgi:hypothetical protein